MSTGSRQRGVVPPSPFLLLASQTPHGSSARPLTWPVQPPPEPNSTYRLSQRKWNHPRRRSALPKLPGKYRHHHRRQPRQSRGLPGPITTVSTWSKILCGGSQRIWSLKKHRCRNWNSLQWLLFSRTAYSWWVIWRNHSSGCGDFLKPQLGPHMQYVVSLFMVKKILNYIRLLLLFSFLNLVMVSLTSEPFPFLA